MKKMLLMTLGLILALGGVVNMAQADQGKKLVAYFSWSGNTRGIAEQIHQKVGGDLVELELVKPYSRDYGTCLDEAKSDLEQEVRPELKTQLNNMADYEVIFLGYPNWWATIPMPIASFLEQYDLSGKTIVPFVSHGGGRLGQSVSDIAKLSPRATILEALSISYSGGRSLSGDIDQWLLKLGLGA